MSWMVATFDMHLSPIGMICYGKPQRLDIQVPASLEGLDFDAVSRDFARTTLTQGSPVRVAGVANPRSYWVPQIGVVTAREFDEWMAKNALGMHDHK